MLVQLLKIINGDKREEGLCVDWMVATQNCKGTLLHVESRAPGNEDSEFDVIVNLSISRDNLMILMNLLRQNGTVNRAHLASCSKPPTEKIPGFISFISR